MQLHKIKRNTKRKKSVAVGRGGARGKTSGRGTKGQKARAGRKIRPEIRDTIKKIPKLRGYAFNSIQKKPLIVKLESIFSVFKDGEEVNPKSLIEKKVVSTYKGKIPQMKVLSNNKSGKSQKLIFTGLEFSKQAKEIVLKAGGDIK